jgi:hypothetical protein
MKLIYHNTDITNTNYNRYSQVKRLNNKDQQISDKRVTNKIQPVYHMF